MKYLKWLLFSYDGCLSRIPFFLCALIYFPALALISNIDTEGWLAWILLATLGIIFGDTLLCIRTKRLHDAGMSGWRQLWLLVIDGFLIVLIFIVFDADNFFLKILPANLINLMLLARPQKLKNNKYRKSDNGSVAVV